MSRRFFFFSYLVAFWSFGGVCGGRVGVAVAARRRRKENRYEDGKASDSRQTGGERKVVQLGAEVPEGLTADQLGNLYYEWLEKLPANVDLVGVYVGGNQMNIVANDDAVWELPDKA